MSSPATAVCGCHQPLSGEMEEECVLQYRGTEGLQVDLQVKITFQLLWLNGNICLQVAGLPTGGV